MCYMHCQSQRIENQLLVVSSIEAVSEEPTYRIGDHIAAFSVNNFGVREWFLGIIENIISPNILSVHI